MDCILNVGFKNWLKNDLLIVVIIDLVFKINGIIMLLIFKFIIGLFFISFCISGEFFLLLFISWFLVVGLICLNFEC